MDFLKLLARCLSNLRNAILSRFAQWEIAFKKSRTNLREKLVNDTQSRIQELKKQKREDISILSLLEPAQKAEMRYVETTLEGTLGTHDSRITFRSLMDDPARIKKLRVIENFTF